MTQDQIKQAIEMAVQCVALMGRNYDTVPRPRDHDYSIAEALLLRDAQLAIALEALDWYTNHLLPDNRPKTGIRARETIAKIKQMETR